MIKKLLRIYRTFYQNGSICLKWNKHAANYPPSRLNPFSNWNYYYSFFFPQFKAQISDHWRPELFPMHSQSVDSFLTFQTNILKEKKSFPPSYVHRRRHRRRITFGWSAQPVLGEENWSKFCPLNSCTVRKYLGVMVSVHLNSTISGNGI